MKNKNCDCGDCCCGKDEKENDEEVRMYFCPKCRSTKVSPIQGWRNAFGLIQKWRCKDCGFENMGFPILVVNKNKLNKKINKTGKNKK